MTQPSDPLQASSDRMKASSRRIAELGERKLRAMKEYDDLINGEQEHLRQLKARHAAMGKELDDKRVALATAS